MRSVSSSVMPATGSSSSSSRVLHEQHADLQPLFLAVGEQAGGRSAWSARRISRGGVGDLVDPVVAKQATHRLALTRLSVLEGQLRFSNTGWFSKMVRLLELAADADRGRSAAR